MKILYIHGLYGNPKKEKIALLSERGHEIVAPFIDYEKEKEAVYPRLKQICQEADIEYIVGSSMGGYFGYWLGQDLKIPQLLFNPALPYRSVLIPIPEIKEDPAVHSWVVVGAKDATIDPELNKQFFEKKTNVRLICCEWLEHRIDMVTFEEMLRWADL
ncbi:MAG: hypothetical protein MK212_12450 [Saprospiraceae bacterium]|nr:hypothetical protein [Saprospiraceae bacterium]